MTQYNVYLIDDYLPKHANLIVIFEKLQEIVMGRRLPDSFHLGFGDDAEQALESAIDPKCIWEALKDPNGIYLVDLDLPAKTRALIDSFRESQDKKKIIIHEHFNKLYDQVHIAGDGLREALDQFDVAFYILLFCQSRGKPTILVSTQTLSSLLNATKSLHIETIAGDAFPNWDHTESPIPPAILDHWARMIVNVSNPLDQIKISTENWFKKSVVGDWFSIEQDGLPHDLKDWGKITVNKHKECVQALFPWCPDKWWENEDNAIAFHQCLKQTVGAHSQWMGEIHDKPLPLCGVYFVFLVVLARMFPDKIEKFLVGDWQCFFSSIKTFTPISFLGDQDPEISRSTISCLYDFFRVIIVQQDMRSFALADFQAPSAGRPFFSLKLNSTQEDIENMLSQIRNTAKFCLAPENSQIKFSTGKKVGMLFRLTTVSQVRNNGFGAYGTIRLDNDPNDDADDQGWLRIGQFETIK